MDLTAVYEYNDFINDGFSVTATGFAHPELLTNNLGAATSVQTNNISSFKNEVKLISYLGRLVYNYDNRYILTANFRRDGSSKFGPDKRWANFPSFALAWRISNERFMNNVRWVDDLKLRLSYGYAGNQENLPPNQYQQLYQPVGPYLYNGQIGQSYGVSQENNPDLKWEVRQSFNAGIDFSIFENRISGTVDFFHDHTSDLLYLYDVPQPPFVTNKVFANAASAVNEGLEISLSSLVIHNKKFSWNLQVNFSTLRNYVTGLLGQFKGVQLNITNPAYGDGMQAVGITRLQVGYPIGVFWIPRHAGFDSAGNELFDKYDQNGKITGVSTTYSDTDKVYIDPTARYTWGFTNSFTLGNFDLSFFITGVQGQKIFANSLMVMGSTVLLPGTNVSNAALTDGFKNVPKPSTFWLRDGSFARLQNLTIGYRFSKIKGISNLRLYMTGTNLFVITNYSGIDPEVITEGTGRYIDKNYYPKSRGFVLGVNLIF
jgi:iron complex outermembrane receptor protein